MKCATVLMVMCTVFTSLAMKSAELRDLAAKYTETKDRGEPDRVIGKELFKELHAKWIDGGLPDDLDKVFEEMDDEGYVVSTSGSDFGGSEMDVDEEEEDFETYDPPVAAAAQPTRGFGNRLERGVDYFVPLDYIPESVADDKLPADLERQLNLIKRDSSPYKQLIRMIKELEESGSWTPEDVAFALNRLNDRWMALCGVGPDADPAMEGYERNPTPMPASKCIFCMDSPAMSSWDFTDPVSHGTFHGEAHCKVSCEECLKNWLKHQIDSSEVMPWITCPGTTTERGKARKCKHLIELQLIQKLLMSIQEEEGTPIYTYKLAAELLKKNLVRKQEWVPCQGAYSIGAKTRQCTDGFVCLGAEEDKRDMESATTGGHFGFQDLSCGMCHTQQRVRKTLDLDTLEKILDKNDDNPEGTYGLTPCCDTPAYKEFGVCNAMTCGPCGMAFSYQDARRGVKGHEAVVGYDSEHMKKRLRDVGSLWMSGAHQGHLDTLSPRSKKNFLAKQGIEFDPNYQRGQ